MSAADEGGPHCRETLREIERFLDGELDPALGARIEAHLSDCSPCMQRAEFRRHLKVMISEKCTEHVAPTGLQDRIRELLDGLETGSR
jgi:mycothiol system anti-sigma-R factor